MSHQTIVKVDNVVLIDEEAREVDCSSMAPEIHVVQWYDDHGWIEFVNQPGAEFRVNEPIDSMAPFQDIIDEWSRAKQLSAFRSQEQLDAFIASQKPKAG